MRQFANRFLIHDIVEDEGGVNARYNMAIDLLWPLDWLGWVQFKILQIQFEEGDDMGDVVY